MTIARLILALVLLCIALPATAAMPCHDGGAMPAAMAMHHQPATDHQDKALTAHVCIGCVPPSSWRRAEVAAPIGSRPTPPIALPASLSLDARTKPTTPPPRLA